MANEDYKEFYLVTLQHRDGSFSNAIWDFEQAPPTVEEIEQIIYNYDEDRKIIFMMKLSSVY